MGNAWDMTWMIGASGEIASGSVVAQRSAPRLLEWEDNVTCTG